MTEERQKIGRLAMRVEGDYWVAYYAMLDTMDGALRLGSIAMAAVVDNIDRKAGFMQMMQEVVSDLLEDRIGNRLEWNDPRPAPESERAGRA